MNIVAWIILAALVLDFLLNLIADILNLRALQGQPPDEFKPYYDAGRYRRSQRYLRDNTRFG
ncbi:MAG: M48 family peptidase, partial [Desulfobacterales bacterium]|nr:M48 family peptidase [Desulfobacterales bacterium]